MAVFPIPGLSDALGKLDQTSEQMGDLITGINRVVELLEEQNNLLGNLEAAK